MNNFPRGILYISDADFSWGRRKQGTGWHFFDERKKLLSEAKLERIKKLAIPPAWTKVRICQNEKGYIQAVGFDDKGRKQYIYHSVWIEYSQHHKFDKMIRFGEVLPILRGVAAGHMRQHSLTKDRILATVVWLLEHTFIRIGNKTYEKDNGSYGLTTLRNKHAEVEGNKVNFSFKGKSGVFHELDITHPRVAQTIKQCIELPGYTLFQYLDDTGQRQTIDSHDVNEYLQEITGEEMSAKDFRTWGGTTLAGEILDGLGQREDKKETQEVLRQMVKRVANHLGNTVAVCRKYYIHPKVVTVYEKGDLVAHFKKARQNYKRNSNQLLESEYAVWTLLKAK